MSYLYLDDGSPDSAEYESNYFQFNSENTKVMALLSKVLKGKDSSSPALRECVQKICEASFMNQECLA